MKALNNTVIKNLSPEMGKEIIKKYQADGWDTKNYKGKSYGDGAWNYYGVIDGVFSQLKLHQVQSYNARIIELNYEPEFCPKRGDMVMVWNKDENEAEQRICVVVIDGAQYPIRTVAEGDDQLFVDGKKFNTAGWKNFKPIPNEQPKTERDIKAEILEKFNEMNRLIEEL
jgi:hypothetical protein